MPKLKDRGAPPVGDHVGEFSRRRQVREEANARARADKAPEVPLGHFSGYCLTEAEVKDGQFGAVAVNITELHSRCKGGATNEAGKFSPCLCPGHDAEFKCHQCKHEFPAKHEGDFDEGLRRCVDRTACAARIAHASAEYRKNSPLHQQIDQIHAEVAARREESRLAGLEAMRQANQAPRTERIVVVREEDRLKAERIRPVRFPQKCHCGCGGMTKGGRFVAGHDMKLKGRLFAVARERTEHDNYDRAGSATDEIVARGWNEAGCQESLLVEARSKDPLEVITQAVRSRYDDQSIEVA